MPTPGHPETQRLLAFNQQMLDQALAVVGHHLAPAAPPYAGPVGAHVRHVIEHYEALVRGLARGVVDYDDRPRELQLEACPRLAHGRLSGLRQALDLWTPPLLDRALQVRGQGGLLGDFGFSVGSSVGRELAFLASHAVHHFALLTAHLQGTGVPLPMHFGRAPATVANDIASRRSPAARPPGEHSCAAPSLST